MITIGTILYFVALIATTRTSPLPSSAIVQVADLASNSCDDGLGVTVYPSQKMVDAVSAASQTVSGETIRLQFLKSYVTELKDIAQQLVDQNINWLIFWNINLTVVASNSLNLPFVQHSGVTAETNSRLYTLIQLAVYANFLKGQETDNDYGPTVKQGLVTLRIKMTKAVCTLRELVLSDTTMSSNTIVTYIYSDYNNKVVSVAGQNPAVKRAFTMTAVKVIAQTLSNIEVVNLKSVTLKNV